LAASEFYFITSSINGTHCQIYYQIEEKCLFYRVHPSEQLQHSFSVRPGAAKENDQWSHFFFQENWLLEAYELI
jgi:hypothetical protein